MHNISVLARYPQETQVKDRKEKKEKKKDSRFEKRTRDT